MAAVGVGTGLGCGYYVVGRPLARSPMEWRQLVRSELDERRLDWRALVRSPLVGRVVGWGPVV